MANPGYKLDVYGTLLETLIEDSGTLIQESAQTLMESTPRSIAVVAADMLTSEESGLAGEYKYRAFVGGAAVVLTTLVSSDLTVPIRDQVHLGFDQQTIAPSRIGSSREECLIYFRGVAASGMASHRELRDHFDFTCAYFTEITQDMIYGGYALLGCGFAAKKLDESYEKVMNAEVAAWVGVPDVKAINWDLLLR